MWLTLGIAMLTSLPATPLHAHHSYTMFDMEKNITLEGTVKEVQWTNPHIWVQLLVKDAATGKEVEWSIEGNSPNMLTRAGWSRKALKAGDKAQIVVHPVKSGGVPNNASLAIVTVDGKRVFGGSGTAPAQTGDGK
jgi:hypothetical protein